MARLKAEGRVLGRAPKLDANGWKLIEDAIREGSSLSSIAKRNKISVSLIRKYYQRDDMDRLRRLGPKRKRK
jgi:DNA invertase Pin-like site-specific DNA recombinase